MIKPLPAGCIYIKKVATWKDFNDLFEDVDIHDEIDHLFIVDIKSNEKEATKNLNGIKVRVFLGKKYFEKTLVQS